MCMHAVIAPNSTHQVFCLAFPPEDVDDDSLLDSSELSDSDSEDEVTFFLPFFAFFPRAFFDLRFFRFLRRLQLLDSESDPRSLEASTALKMVSRALSSVFSMPSLYRLLCPNKGTKLLPQQVLHPPSQGSTCDELKASIWAIFPHVGESKLLAPKLIKLLHSWGRLGFFSMSFLPHVDHPSCHHKFDWPTPNRSDTLLPLVHGSSMPYSHVFGSRKIHAAAPRTRFWTSLPCNFPTVLAAAPISLCLGIYFIKKHIIELLHAIMMILRIPCAYVQNLLKWHRAYTFIYICNFYVFAGVLSGRDPKQTKGQYFAARPAACISLGEFGPKKVQDIWIYDLSKK